MLSQEDVDESYALALEFCGECLDYHLTRPFLVASGLRGGPGRDSLVFAPLLARWVAPRSRLLIAGAADAGVLQFILDTLRGPLDITVADRCKTPLEICRRYASRRGHTITTLQVDLTELSATEAFDVIVLHAILPSIAESRRVDVLHRMARALASGGSLIMAHPLYQPSGRRAGQTQRVLEGLVRNGIHLPKPPDVLLAALDRFEDVGGHPFDAETADLEGAVTDAGLHIIESLDSAPGGRRLRRYIAATKPPFGGLSSGA